MHEHTIHEYTITAFNRELFIFNLETLAQALKNESFYGQQKVVERVLENPKILLRILSTASDNDLIHFFHDFSKHEKKIASYLLKPETKKFLEENGIDPAQLERFFKHDLKNKHAIYPKSSSLSSFGILASPPPVFFPRTVVPPTSTEQDTTMEIEELSVESSEDQVMTDATDWITDSDGIQYKTDPDTGVQYKFEPFTSIEYKLDPSTNTEYIFDPSTGIECITELHTGKQCTFDPTTGIQCVFDPTIGIEYVTNLNTGEQCMTNLLTGEQCIIDLNTGEQYMVSHSSEAEMGAYEPNFYPGSGYFQPGSF